MEHEYPRGSTTFAGAQVRNLIHSVCEYLGAVEFSAAALYLKVRENWMAWDHAKLSEHLHRAVNLNRFLIRPDIVRKKPANRILGIVFRRFGPIFQRGMDIRRM